MNGTRPAPDILPTRHNRTAKTLGKRPAADAILDYRATKQPRLGINEDSVTSRWTRVLYEVIDLTKDTFTYLVFGDGPVLPVAGTPQIPNARHHPVRYPRAMPSRQRLQSQYGKAMLPPVPNGVEDGSHPPSLPNGTAKASTSSLYDEPSRSSLDSGVHIASTSSGGSTAVDRMPGPPPPRKTRAEPLELREFRYREQLRALESRPHILQEKHRAQVQHDRRRDQEEMLHELYRIKRGLGYKSDIGVFRELLTYKQRLERMEHKDILSPSRSMSDIRSTYSDESSSTLNRRHSSYEDLQPEFLQRALQNARATLNSPKPPRPFSPEHERIRTTHKAFDELIEQRLRPKRPPLPESLPAPQEAEVKALLKKRGVISKYAREQVSDRDLCRLAPGQWLNDEIINFYGALIMGRSEGSKENPVPNTATGSPKAGGAKVLNVHYFSTFFWTKLTTDGYDKGRLAKWTKKIDIFSKDAILIPVNHNNTHWTAAAINFRRKRIESYDSMNMNRTAVYKHLRNYLDAEHRNKKKTPFDFTGWVDYVPTGTPQQENGYDCGVFTCQVLNYLAQDLPLDFTQQNIPYLRKRMIWEIGNTILQS